MEKLISTRYVNYVLLNPLGEWEVFELHESPASNVVSKHDTIDLGREFLGVLVSSSTGNASYIVALNDDARSLRAILLRLMQQKPLLDDNTYWTESTIELTLLDDDYDYLWTVKIWANRSAVYAFIDKIEDWSSQYSWASIPEGSDALLSRQLI